MTPISSPPVSSREVVLSKTSLAGICLITFACGIVTTVMVDRAQSRAGDQVTAREPDPSLTRPAAEPTPPAPPTATAPAMAPAATPSVAAAADPLVVQMPNLDEASKAHTIHAVPVAPLRPRVAETAVATAKSKTPAAVAPFPVAIKAKPAVVATAAPKTASLKAASPKASRSKKAKAATDSSDPANGWVDPFSL